MTDAYLRFPHLSGDSRDLVTFVAEDDIWIAPVGGGRAWRLSADRVPVTNPRFSPDGDMIVWTSTRHDAPEVLVAPTDGGASRRLTYWGGMRTSVCGWNPAGEIVAVTEAGEASANRRWAYAVPLDGSPPQRLPYGWVGEVAFGPGEQVLVSTPHTFRGDLATWKRYRGGTAARLWLDRNGGGQFERLLAQHGAGLTCPMWVGDQILVVSDHEGVGNVYRLDAEDGRLARLTDHDFYVRHATSGGGRVVYQVLGELWLLDDAGTPGATPQRLDISLGGTRTSRQPVHVAAKDCLGSVVPDLAGRASAVEVRGTLHWVTHRDGPVPALVAEPGVRVRCPTMVGVDRVAWVTDADGDDAVEVRSLLDEDVDGSRTRVASGQLGRVLELVASPDGRFLAAASHDGRLLLMPADEDGGGRSVREVARSEHGEVTGPAFSPDSAWLAWSQPGPEPLRQIRMARIDEGDDLAVTDVTPLRFNDFAPTFTRDGKHLAFLSVRSFDPVYDAFVFDLSFPSGCRPQLVPLASTTPSPFSPELYGRPADDRTGEDKTSAGNAAEHSPVTTVDADGLDQRVVPFPVPAARFTGLRAVKDGVVWLRQPLVGELGNDLTTPNDDRPRAALERFDLVTRRCDVLADAVDAAPVSGDGTRVVLVDKGKLTVVPTDHKVPDGPEGDADRVEVDLDRVRVQVDPAAEWRQSFDEAGRLMRDNFWRADMGGLDWAGVLDRYRPVVDRLGGHDDLVDLLWEVQGELGTSHAYVLPGGLAGPPRDPVRRLGLLGADLTVDEDGTWRVARIFAGEPSDPRARSPLTAPGVGVRQGDAILAVDGREVSAGMGPAALLVGTADRPVELTARSVDGEVRRVVVVPLADETPLRYQDWVGGRRRFVHEASGGRLGYLHVPDMVSTGWAQLHRDLRLEMARDGLVVDVRENRGGHTSELVVEKLARRVVGWNRGRGLSPQSYPADAPRGPVVAVTDEWAGSDGDIVTAAIQALGVGQVVGARTWGGVVGVDLKYSLVDGTMVTQPRYSFWLKGPGWGVENYGVDPDIDVVVTPQDRVAGRDPQLDTAVRVALEQLDAEPPARPPDLPPLDHSSAARPS